MDPHSFFSKEDEKRIVEAIVKAESMTTGEIRVHVDSHSSLSPFDAAVKTFSLLGMDKTKHKNGVLFYILCDDRAFAVIGDRGIDLVVPNGFWDDICVSLSNYFKQGDFAGGLEFAILKCGAKLKEFFPSDSSNEDELPNDISYGKNE